MCIFSQYKDILGVPSEGIHAIRLFDYHRYYYDLRRSCNYIIFF